MTHANRSRISVPLTALAALFLVLSLPAAAAAYHPDRSEMERVQEVAHELEDAAQRVHRMAERAEHHYDRREQRALAALHELEEAADHFHDQVERYRRDPYHTESDFRALERAYGNAYHAFHGLHAYRHIERSFYRVSELMNDLRYYYSDRSGQGRYRGHGEYRRNGQYRRGGQYGYDRDGRGYRDGRDYGRGQGRGHG